jgi:hypothetical protein
VGTAMAQPRVVLVSVGMLAVAAALSFVARSDGKG